MDACLGRGLSQEPAGCEKDIYNQDRIWDGDQSPPPQVRFAL